MHRTLCIVMLLVCANGANAQDHREDPEERVPVVFDAQGRPIGELTSFNWENGVLFSVGQAHVVIGLMRKNAAGSLTRLSATQYEWDTDYSLNYTTSDCSGEPVVDSYRGPWPAVSFREGSTVTVYFPSDVPLAPMVERSHRDEPSGQCGLYNSPVPSSGWPAGARLVITRGHPEPLSVE